MKDIDAVTFPKTKDIDATTCPKPVKKDQDLI